MRPAWMPPIIGSTKRYASSVPSFLRTISPMVASSPTASRLGRYASRRAARCARQVTPLNSTIERGFVGTPRTRSLGSSCKLPRDQSHAPLVGDRLELVGETELGHERDRFGAASEEAVGAEIDRCDRRRWSPRANRPSARWPRALRYEGCQASGRRRRQRAPKRPRAR